VVVDNDRIQWVGPMEDLVMPEDGDLRIIDAAGHLVIPGLVNAHTHNVYYLMRGLGMDAELKEWLERAIWPGLMRIDRQAAYQGSLLGCLENLLSGVTCVADNYYMHRERKENIDGVLEAALDSGIRLFMARGFHDFRFNVPEEFLETPEEILGEYRRMIDTWHGREDRIFVMVSPVNLLYSQPDTILQAGELAREYGLCLHTHVAEAGFEVREIHRRYRKNYIEVLDRLGVVNERFHAVHSVMITRPEMAILAERGATVVLNPASNLLLASGVAPVEEMKEAGVRIALGTDAPNNTQDMMQSMKLAAILPRILRHNPLAVTSREALRMATMAGAEALGMDDRIGSLEPGKYADITMVSMGELHNTPVYDPVANLVYSAHAGDVRTVMVSGEILVKDGCLVHHSEREVAAKTGELCSRMFDGLS